jgi:hypothetical protein
MSKLAYRSETNVPGLRGVRVDFENPRRLGREDAEGFLGHSGRA